MTSFLTPCQDHFCVEEKASCSGEHRHGVFTYLSSYSAVSVPAEDKLEPGVFMRTENNNKLALSIEDETSLESMQEFHWDEQNSWIAPLPSRSPRPCLPNNRTFTSTFFNVGTYPILGREKSIQDLSSLAPPHSYTQQSLSSATYFELCFLSNSFNLAIGTVAYLRVTITDVQFRVVFVLCELILDELDHKPDTVKFYCDSKVVLGDIPQWLSLIVCICAWLCSL